MQIELTNARAVVQTATKECDELLNVIGMNTKEVEGKQAAALSKEAQLKVRRRPLHAAASILTREQRS